MPHGQGGLPPALWPSPIDRANTLIAEAAAMVVPAAIQDAFGIVIFAVVAVAVVVAIVSLLASPGLYDQIGRGALSLRHERDPAPPPSPPGGAAGVRDRDDEIRQLLAARNERRRRRGEAQVDVEDELRRLTARAAADEGLRAEVRELVIARNERRERAGKEVLDVEAEVERQLREIDA